MPQLFRYCPVLLVLALGCRSQVKSEAKDAVSDGIKAMLPGAMIEFLVPADQIEQHVQPAQPGTGLPDTLAGIWWTDAKSIQRVVSFRNVYWDGSTRTASILFTGPGMYSFPESEHGALGAFPGVHSELYDGSGYDIIFSPDFKSARLVDAQEVGGNRQQDASKGFTMDFVADGDWVRHTPGKPDYHLRRIVTADGKREPAYQDYLKRFGARAWVTKAASNLSKPGDTLSFDLKDGNDLYYVEIWDPQAQGVNARSIHAESPIPLIMTAVNAGGRRSTNDGAAEITTIFSSPLPVSRFNSGKNPVTLQVKSRDGVGGHVTLTVSDPTLVRAQLAGGADLPFVPNKKYFINFQGLPPGHYRVAASGAVPVTIQNAARYGRDSDDKAVLPATDTYEVELRDNDDVYLGAFLSIDGAQSQTINVRLTNIDVMSNHGSVSINGPAITGKLESRTSVHVYNIDPQTLALDGEPYLVIKVVGDGRPRDQWCCVFGYFVGTDFTQEMPRENGLMYSGFDAYDARIFVNKQPSGKFQVMLHYLDNVHFNVADETLTYSLQFVKNP